MNEDVCEAIETQRVLAFEYGHEETDEGPDAGGCRVVEPHVYGETADGEELLRGYQTGGYSASEEPVGWKLFDVAEIEELVVTAESFDGPRPEYEPEDPALVDVYCRL